MANIKSSDTMHCITRNNIVTVNTIINVIISNGDIQPSTFILG